MITRKTYNQFLDSLIENNHIYFWLHAISDKIIYTPNELLNIFAMLFYKAEKPSLEEYFHSEIMINFPSLKENDIQPFIPRIAFEFAKLIAPEKSREIEDFPIDGYCSFEMENNYLIITYKGLFGEKYFEQLASIFNGYDKDFAAYYTDRPGFPDFRHNRVYALCINADVFLNHLFSITAPSSKAIDSPSGSYRKKSQWRIDHEATPYANGDKPVNHFIANNLERKILECHATPLKGKNENVENTLVEWRNEKRNKISLGNFLYFALNLKLSMEIFPSDVLKHILFIMLCKIELETLNNNKPQKISSYIRFGFSGLKAEGNSKYPSQYTLTLINNALDNEKATDCVISDDTVILKFTLMRFEKYAVIENKFIELLGERNKFTLHHDKDEIYSHAYHAHYNIYVTFPKNKLDLIERKMEYTSPHLK